MSNEMERYCTAYRWFTPYVKTGEKMGTEGYTRQPVIPHAATRRTMIEIDQGNYRWQAVQQKDQRVWLVREYQDGHIINSYAVHDENIAGEVRKTIGTAEV
jgi:hypothetical protein